VYVQVFERVSSLVKVDPSQGHRPLAGFSVTIADCGAMPASYRSPVHGAALRNDSGRDGVDPCRGLLGEVKHALRVDGEPRSASDVDVTSVSSGMS
jgi:hypothetical protein